MDEKYQVCLLLGAIKDYQSGLMPLGMLVNKVEGILDVLQKESMRDKCFDALLALEEVYARMRTGSFDFEKDGRPVVDRAVQDMLIKAESFL